MLALKMASSSLKLRLVTFFPRDSPHFFRLSASHASAFLRSEAIKFTHCLKKSERQVCIRKELKFPASSLQNSHIFLYMCVMLYHMRFLTQRRD
jgi:hypothetical protein